MNMEANKILAALLVAGIIAMLAGFISNKLVHPETLEENAFKVEVAESDAGASGAPAAPQTADPIDGLMASADVAHGEKIAKVCAACHTFNKGGPNRVGPNLAGIVGAKRAHLGDFAYSDAMKNAGGTWTVENLNQYFWNPKKAIPGNKMVFAGLKKPEDRAALIKWLQTQK